MNKALVLLSGGMKSAIVLYMAKRYNPKVFAVRVGCEYTCKRKRDQAFEIADAAKVDFRICSTNLFLFVDSKVQQFSDIDSVSGDPSWEFRVPGSQASHYSVALNVAVSLGCREIYTGLRQVRRYFTIAEYPQVAVVDPLMGMTTSAVVELAKETDRGGEADMWAVLAKTYSCELGEPAPCGQCRACINRALGFINAGFPDPLIVQCQKSGLYPKDWLNSGLHPKFVTNAGVAQDAISE